MGVYYPSVGYNIEVGLPAYSAMVGYMQGFHFSFTSWQLVTDVSVDSPPPLLSRDKEFCCVVSSGFSLGRVHVARLISPLWWHALHNSSVMLLFCLLSCSNLVFLLILELSSHVATLNYFWIKLSLDDLCFLVMLLVSSRVVCNTVFISSSVFLLGCLLLIKTILSWLRKIPLWNCFCSTCWN